MNTLNMSMSPSTSNDDIKVESINKEKEEEEKKEENNIENNIEDIKEGEKVEDKKSVKIAVKFGNSSNIPNIDLGEDDLNDGDEELK